MILEKKRTHCLLCDKELTKEQMWRDGIFCSNACRGTHRKQNYICPYDSAFLKTDNELRSYFLGLFVSDGYFGKSRHVRINLTDKQIIFDLVERIQFKKKISEQPEKGNYKRKYGISLYGPAPDFIGECGYAPGPKTGKEFTPTCVSKDTFHHFLRGIIDGDGSMHMAINDCPTWNNYLLCKIVCASENFLTSLHSKLQESKIVVGGSIHRVKKVKYYFVLQFGHYDSVNIGNYVYRDSTIRLERKYDNYIKLRDIKLKREPQKHRVCSIPDCDEQALSKGLCSRHYYAKLTGATKEYVSYDQALKLGYLNTYHKLRMQGYSTARAADQIGIPQTTLRGWEIKANVFFDKTKYIEEILETFRELYSSGKMSRSRAAKEIKISYKTLDKWEKQMNNDQREVSYGL